MGRKAKPIGLHLVQKGGKHLTKNEIKHRIENEVKPLDDNIQRPDLLKHDPVAQAEWRFMVKVLPELGLLTNIDSRALAIYCEAVSAHMNAVEKLREQGPVVNYENTSGAVNRVKNPWQQIKMENYKIIKDMLAKFGLTVADRASLAIPKEDGPKEDPLSKFGDV